MIVTTVREEIKKQILEMIDQLYLVALDNDTFGFAKVSIADMIAHLHTTYGPITHSNLETNCGSTTNMWTPDDPIKTLWECLCKVQHISIVGGDPLTNGAICNLMLTFLKQPASLPPHVTPGASSQWLTKP